MKNVVNFGRGSHRECSLPPHCCAVCSVVGPPLNGSASQSQRALLKPAKHNDSERFYVKKSAFEAFDTGSQVATRWHVTSISLSLALSLSSLTCLVSVLVIFWSSSSSSWSLYHLHPRYRDHSLCFSLLALALVLCLSPGRLICFSTRLSASSAHHHHHHHGQGGLNIKPPCPLHDSVAS